MVQISILLRFFTCAIIKLIVIIVTTENVTLIWFITTVSQFEHDQVCFSLSFSNLLGMAVTSVGRTCGPTPGALAGQLCTDA